MSIDVLQSLEIIENLENFIDRVRPPEEMRHQLDIAYKIEDQSIIIYELRPVRDNSKELQEGEIAKATFVKNKNTWKVFWIRANLKWENYKPAPMVKNVHGFIKIVEEDKYGCFWG